MIPLYLFCSRWCFLVVSPCNHLMLCGGSKMDMNVFKDFLYKLIHRSHDINKGIGFDYLEQLSKDTYIGDGIKIHIHNFDIMLNLSRWNKNNFDELSQQLFKYITKELNLEGYNYRSLKDI